MFSPLVLSHPHEFALDTARITAICEHIASFVDIPQAGILNIAFLPDTEIQALNKAYRGIDTSTDVLSFHYFEDFSSVESTETAGEIIMSESKVLTHAIEHGHSPLDECEILIIHGILHILGYDHENDEDYQEMWEVEQAVRNVFGLHSHDLSV